MQKVPVQPWKDVGVTIARAFVYLDLISLTYPKYNRPDQSMLMSRQHL